MYRKVYEAIRCDELETDDDMKDVCLHDIKSESSSCKSDEENDINYLSIKREKKLKR